jgi:hypothetical protein
MEENGTLHSSQASDLLGGNGWLRILQDAPEMFVANLTLPFEEKMKRGGGERRRISEICDWGKSQQGRKYIPLDDPRLPRSNLFPNRYAVKKPRSGATGKKKDPGKSRVEFRVNRKKIEKGIIFLGLPLPDAPRPFALRATWP